MTDPQGPHPAPTGLTPADPKNGKNVDRGCGAPLGSSGFVKVLCGTFAALCRRCKEATRAQR